MAKPAATHRTQRRANPHHLHRAPQRLPTRRGRAWGLPLALTVLPAPIHLRTNLTTRALAAVFCTSQSAVDRIIHHLVPVLAHALRPDPDNSNHPGIIDGI
jgi:Helix-turn-helix of DDE superfamily endonuclease